MRGFRSLGIIVSAVFAILNLTQTQSALAAIAPSMEVLGRTSLGKVFHDSDFIDLGRCGVSENLPVRSVQVEVRFAPVELNEIVLQFGDGTEQRLPVREYFQPGSHSRVIDLIGDRRCVQHIYVTGRTLDLFGPHGTVIIYGSRHYGGDHDHDRDHDHDGDYMGRRFLGATYLDDHHDHDVIRLGECYHRPGGRTIGRDVARLIQFRVVGNNAEINQVTVVFRNGESQDIPMRQFFQENSTSDPKNLNGDRRCIQEIFVSGRTIDRPGQGYSEARFEVYALE